MNDVTSKKEIVSYIRDRTLFIKKKNIVLLNSFKGRVRRGYGGTLLSCLNFRGTPIILVNNKKVFSGNLSIISQLSSQNHGDL